MTALLSRLANEEIERARSRFDLIAADVALKRKGRELAGLCPFHAEKSPSFYVATDKGFFHCFGCGAHGTAIDYVMRTRGLDFVDAVHEINGTTPKRAREAAPLPAAPADAEPNPDKQAEIEAILRECGPVAPGTAAYLYLHTRYLRSKQPALLAHPALPCWELGRGPDGQIQRLPALVAPFVNSGDQITAILRIWLTDVAVVGDPNRARDNRAPLKQRKKGLGVMGDGAIRLTPIERVHDRLGLAEGVETADSARQLYRVPVWACGGTARLGFPGHWRQRHTAPGERPRIWVPPDRPPRNLDTAWISERPPSIWIPDSVEHLFIFGDTGETGETVARYAADFWLRQGLDAGAVFPKAGFSDFNDELIAAVDAGEIVRVP